MQAIYATRPGGHIGYVGVTPGDLPAGLNDQLRLRGGALLPATTILT
jgi:threonine dehydrogenase-like Zn-dependent dehydrogenase